MSLSNPFPRRWWWLIPLGAALFILAADLGRIKNVQRVTALGRAAGNDGKSAATTRHWLIVPEHNLRSYQWMAETEQMLARGEWRVRQIDYENAPVGREVHAASPYRWWLGLVTWLMHVTRGGTTGESLEAAALWAGPLFHLALLVAGTVFIAKRFGPIAAAAFSLGLALLFPLAGEFLPGVPDDHGLGFVCAGASALLLLDGLARRRRSSFVLSGVAGGLGLWISVAIEVPVLVALGLGGFVLALWKARRPTVAEGFSPCWNEWALAGALTSLLAYLAEYFPAHLELRLQANHPVYGLAWIGLGWALTLADRWRARVARSRSRTWLMAAGALLALASLPVTMAVTQSRAFLVANPLASRATNLPNGAVARNLAVWLSQDGQKLAVLATCLPFVLLVPLGISALRRNRSAAEQATFLVGGSVVLVSAALACAQIQAWAVAQSTLLVLVVAAAPLFAQRVWLIAAFCLLPGVIQLARSTPWDGNAPVTRLEVEGLLERDLAHWIADHSESAATAGSGPLVLAAPERTPGMWFYGGLRGLGSPNWENRDGVALAVKILGATTLDEAQALLARRGVTHLVLPSWDTEMDEFVKWTKNNPADTFLAALHRWALPPWLQPLPYRLPEIAGFEGRSVLVLKITEDTDRALSLSRLAEYALEMEDAPLTSAVNDALAAFPANLVALIGRAQIEKARGNAAGFDQISTTIRQNLTNGLDRLLPWDRRLSLAVVLAQGGQTALARPPLQRCIADLNEARIRSLGPGALYRLLVLSKALDVPIASSALRDLALSLLPAEARARL